MIYKEIKTDEEILLEIAKSFIDEAILNIVRAHELIIDAFEQESIHLDKRSHLLTDIGRHEFEELEELNKVCERNLTNFLSKLDQYLLFVKLIPPRYETIPEDMIQLKFV